MLEACKCTEFKLWYVIRRKYSNDINVCHCGHRDWEHLDDTGCFGQIVIVDGGV